MSSYGKFKEEWVALYNQGMSMNAISAQYNVSSNTVKNVIKDDVQLRKNAGKYDDYIDFWVNEYKLGASIQQIARTYKVPHSTVKMNLLKNGIEIRTNKPSSYLKYTEQWTQLYAQGSSLKEIGEQFGVAADTVKAIILPYIQTRDYIESSNSVPLNETFFEAIDTEEKAYWLGVCYAFGYISRKQVNDEEFKVTFVFKENELHIAEALKQQLNTEKKISFNANENLSRLEFLNRPLILSLVDAGIQPNEKRGFQFPLLAQQLQLSFLVGYFEKRIYLNRSRIYVQAPNNMATKIQQIFSDLGVQGEIRQTKSLHVVSWVTMSSADTRAFLEIIREYKHLIRSERLLKILEKRICDKKATKIID